MRILLIDHHDSYTHILGHLLQQAAVVRAAAGAGSGHIAVDMVSHDDPRWHDPHSWWGRCAAGEAAVGDLYQLVVLSPGPGNPCDPHDVGVSMVLAQQTVPVWGVCLGHQIMAVSEGAQLQTDHSPHHGVVSPVHHSGTGIWEGIPQGVGVVRYHSLAVGEPVPPGVTVTSRADDGTVMSVEVHSPAPRWGVQFHPESIDTPVGVQLAANVVRLAAQWWRQQRSVVELNEVPAGLTGEQVATIVRQYAQPGELLRWLDDSLEDFATETPHGPTGRNLSMVSLCVAEKPQHDTSPDSEVREVWADDSRLGWVGAITYEGGNVGFAYTTIAVWGGPRGWRVYGYNTARVLQISQTLRVAAQQARSGTVTGELAHAGAPRRELSTAALKPQSSPEVSSTSDNATLALSAGPKEQSTQNRKDRNAQGKGRGWLRRRHKRDIDATETTSTRATAGNTNSPIAAAAGAEASARISVAALSAWDQPTYLGALAVPQKLAPGAPQNIMGLLGPDAAHYSAQFYECQRVLKRGDSYEMCLTDAFRLPRSYARAPWDAYHRLRRQCPTHYGAYLEMDDPQQPDTIISVSPELFVEITDTGVVRTRPMKGTAPRDYTNPERDRQLAAHLAADEKTRAENLMVIDLARSDLARVCQPGSVRVTRDRVVETYQTVHQLVTEVEGRLREGCSALEAVRACFPPASMTGAPKERTIECLADIERTERGIYSGVIGFIADNGAAEFSVVIRTALYQGQRVTVGAGGAITVDSDCASEHAELLHKGTYVVSSLLDPQNLPPVVESFWCEHGKLLQLTEHCDPLPLHRERFVTSVRQIYGEASAYQAGEFFDWCMIELRSRGEVFPQIRWELREGRPTGVAMLDRPCPARLSTVRVALAMSLPDDVWNQLADAGYAPLGEASALGDPRWLTQVKGPDMRALDILRQAGLEMGAQEVILADRWGNVLEGTHSSILWWDGDTLCGPPHSAVLPSTMRQQLEAQAWAEGLQVEERWLPLSELHNYPVLSVNALHGVRRVTGWV